MNPITPSADDTARHAGWKWFSVIFIFLLGAGVAALWPGRGTALVEVDIPPGIRAPDAARTLKKAGMLWSSIPFRFWVRVRLAGAKIHPGRYHFAPDRSAFWIVNDLIQGRTEKVRLVIPEGFSSWQIAERLASLKLCDAESFKLYVSSAQLEGFLFPATYDMDGGTPVPSIAHRFVKEFDARWTPELDARAKSVGLSRAQAVTLASIIQREVRHEDELPTVAAVYLNRLKKGMPLQADPTVQYALGHWKIHLTYDDYRQTKSPYNTYLVAGLPPGPICSPGMPALRAALWPASTSALFLLAREDGYHTLSTSYREHTNKVNRRNRELRRTQ